MKPESLSEQAIQRQILDFLAVKARAGGLYFTKVPLGAMKVGNQRSVPNPMRGFPDILVCYRGRFVGIEVKHPNKSHGNPETRTRQARVQGELKAAGAIILVVDSVDSVAAFFGQYDAGHGNKALDATGAVR